MRYIIFFIIIVSFIHPLRSQNFKEGKIGKQHFDIQLNTEQSLASAVVLYKNRNTSFLLRNAQDNWKIIDKVHKVVKINTQKGQKYATTKINLYNDNQNKETISKIEASTYNTVNGKVIKEKVKGDAIYTNKINDNWTEVSIVFPTVKAGSIIEYSYEVKSPFWKIEDLIFQENIPVRISNAIVKIPHFFDFKRFVKGYIEIQPKESIGTKTMNVTYSEKGAYGVQSQSSNLASLKFKESISEYNLKDIPALKNEVYINNLNNYRSSVVYELASFEFNQGEKKSYTTTWEKVINRINESWHFGKALNKINFFENEAINLRANSTSKDELLYNTYKYIRDNMSWNGQRDKYASQPLKKAFQTKSGNVADINLLLVGLLKEVGFVAYPVLTSTKDNGIPIYPTLEGFNYVIGAVEHNGKWVLLDATTRIGAPDVLPERTINWEGRMVLENGTSHMLSLFTNKGSRNQKMVEAHIEEDFNVKGVLRQRLANNAAFDFRKKFLGLNDQEQQETFQETYHIENIEDLEVNASEINKPATIRASFNIENMIENIGDKMYFSPLLFLKMQKNPFISETRDYPIDFVYPKVERSNVHITLPEGYVLNQLPKNIELQLPENVGSYTLIYTQQGNKLQLTRSFKINQTIVSAKFYNEIKDFYSQIVAKEKEKVVLTKK